MKILNASLTIALRAFVNRTLYNIDFTFCRVGVLVFFVFSLSLSLFNLMGKRSMGWYNSGRQSKSDTVDLDYNATQLIKPPN